MVTPRKPESAFPSRRWEAGLVAVAIAGLLFSEFWLGVLHPHGWAADFKIYYTALSAAQNGRSPYFPYLIGVSFVYHPFALTLVSLFGHLGRLPASVVWAVLNGSGYAISLWMALRLGPEMPPSRRGLVIVLFAAFAPFWEMLHIGQINGMVLACLLGSLYLAERESAVLAGVALALAIALKSSPLVFVAWFLAARQWKVGCAALVALVVLSLIAWTQFGTSVLRDYLTVLSRVGAETHPDFYNESLSAFTIRALSVMNMRGIEATAAMAQKLLAAALIAGTLLLTVRFAGTDKQQRVRLFALLSAVMTVASPLVWYHHNVFLVLPLMVLLAAPVDHPGTFRTGAGAYVLIQMERLVEEFTRAVSFDDTAPSAHTAAGLPVLIAQTFLIAVLAAITLRAALPALLQLRQDSIALR